MHSEEHERFCTYLYNVFTARLADNAGAVVLHDVRVPCTVVVGDADFMTPVKAGEHMKALLDDCELVVLPGCTHYIQFENPRGVGEAVEGLLARCC